MFIIQELRVTIIKGVTPKKECNQELKTDTKNMEIMELEAIKLELMTWLSKLEDQDIIEYLKVVKDSQEAGNDWWDELTEEQKKGVERGLKDVKEGRIISHEEVRKTYGI